MKLNKLFHWLYASVMALPLVVTPIFAVYSHRHTIDSYSVQESELLEVNFNQQVNVLNSDANGTLSYFSETYTYTYDYSNTGEFYCRSVFTDNLINWIYGNKYYIKVVSTDEFTFRTASSSLWFPINDNGSPTKFIYNCLYNEDSYLYFGKYSANVGDNFSFQYLQVFNLTQMFGVGNEPTIQQFDTWYPNDFYSYTLSHIELLDTGNYITFNDTDVGSQFIYDMYNCVDKYFNYDKVVNFGDLYDWLNLTFFSGQAPLGFFIFWHLLEYWLLTSLLWLLFDVLIYVPMLVHRWLDKASLS